MTPARHALRVDVPAAALAGRRARLPTRSHRGTVADRARPRPAGVQAARVFAAAAVLSCVGISIANAHETARAASQLAPSESGPLRETATIAAEQPIASMPGKRLVSVIVDYPPGASSLSHRHAPSAFIYAHVLSGAVRSQVDDEPVRTYRAGEGWFEQPGAHHRVSENASDSEPARLLAVFIVDLDDETLTLPDAAQTGGSPDAAAD